ncbi:serine/threonine protein kinase [Streptomyces sp. A0592]|uniref:serine/threonine-protein kinase n=1 Tax=Streptomyces sp. A0592 TaxID=2563099 RepID=UPI00109E4874|nr:serine/threonine protein kinase [Streptomyces sp. A0592]THA86955.1 serine/threonine protein kinase [Streptomyces sp. A0592]
MFELTGSGAEPLEAEDPRRIGPIPLAGRLGAGGMGRVYLGVREGRYVAVKQLLASVVGEDEDFLRRFGHELDNLARLPAGATAPLLGGDRTARPPWFATAYVPGITLREALTLHGGPLPADALWLLLREAAASLASVHALDMVHRDLKPSNVMLTLDGLTLIDFGVARAAEQSRLTRTGMVVGTPAYMAPEQASGKRRLSGATDVFALGSVLAYAACGRPPFGDESGHGVLYRIVHEEPDLEPLRELEPELAELVEACLAKDPDDRPTAADLLARASRQGPFTQPLWPVAIDGRLTERAAFAANVQGLDVPTLPLAGGKPDPAEAAEPATPGPEATPPAGPGPEGPERRERRRRTRVLLAVLPVVVVSGGTTLAIQYLPHMSAPRAEARNTPAAPVTAPAGTGAAAGGSPSGTAPPAQPPTQDPGQAQGATGGAPVTAAGGTGPGAGPEAVPGGGAQPGPGGSGSSANAGGNGGGSRPSAGGTSTAPTAAPAQPPSLPDSGTYRYRNGNNGKCITQVFGASDFGDCGNGSARWTVQSRSDGSFKLVNQQSGSCLYSNGLGQAVFVGDCAQDIGRVWRTGSGGSLRSDLGGGCLDLGMSSGLVTRTCGGEASQRWTKQS